MYRSKKLIKYQNIKHYFFSRKNGCSTGIYKSLNCGKGSNDKKKNILQNLKFVSKKIGINYKNLILMNQTHSNKAVLINKKNKNKKKFKCDALVTQEKNIAIGVLTADCVPIILFDSKSQTIGCIHSGWKGGISGIIENTLKIFDKINSSNNLIASVGPCIGKNSYEVGKELLKKFEEESKYNSVFFLKKNNGRFLFNIRGYVNEKLKKQGVKSIDNIKLDTFQDRDKFYSYRRSQILGEKDYGRCISTICLI